MLEDEGVVDVDGLADLVVHGVDVCLVHGHALPGQGRGVVDGDVVELRVVLPVLVWKTHTNTVNKEHPDSKHTNYFPFYAHTEN